MTATAWGILGTLKHICSAVWRHAASMATSDLSHDRGTIVQQILGRFSTAMTLQSLMRFRRSLPHLSSGPVGGLKVDGGVASTGRLGLYLICGCMEVGGWGGNRALRIYWWAFRVASASSTLVRALIMLAGALVRPWIHSRNGCNCYSKCSVDALTNRRYQVLVGERK